MSALALPSIANAPLPAVYEQATRALAECSRIDECQDWADKAQAMASYARQAKDDTMRKMADRIQARAIRRCGELLQQVQPARGHENGSAPTRSQAASDAGLSEHQRKTALRVASVPESTFVSQVESPDPPTVTALAKQGTASKPKPLVDLGAIPPADYARATEALGMLRGFADYCAKNDAQRIAAAIQPHELDDVRRQVEKVDAWLDRFVVNLRSN